ncbi:MAG: hypothetical protein GTO30_10200, partial [Acidobacteria bacterium]|nr:hypothetical protein [Acidobacteriota bacterium]NIO60634.1 hypothetical protein [Acidobacteriota bacterium]NIQ86995.1 hypothetical protein [Acidobacteriota bacterium]
MDSNEDNGRPLPLSEPRPATAGTESRPATVVAPGPSGVARAGRWFMRLVVIFLFLQLGLWMFVGRKSLVRLAPDMIVDDVRSVAALGQQFDGDRTY